MNKTIVKQNLEKLLGDKEGDLGYIKWNESVAGNAGTYEGLPCIGANFYFDKINGCIIYFGNYQLVPKSIRSKYKESILRLAVNYEDGEEKIVYVRANDLTEEARENLGVAVLKYNKIKAVPKRVAQGV